MDSMMERIRDLESKIQISKVRFPSLDQMSFEQLLRPAMEKQMSSTSEEQQNKEAGGLYQSLQKRPIKSPVRLTDNFLQFASQHQPNLKQNTSPFSHKCTNEYEKTRDLASLKEKYLKKTKHYRQQPQIQGYGSQKLYTPIVNRNQDSQPLIFFGSNMMNKFECGRNLFSSVKERSNDVISRFDGLTKHEEASTDQV